MFEFSPGIKLFYTCEKGCLHLPLDHRFDVLKSNTVGFRTIDETRAIKLTQIIIFKKWIHLNDFLSLFPFFLFLLIHSELVAVFYEI